MSKFTLVLDSSQISNYLECNQQWIYQYNQRLMPAQAAARQDRSAMNAGTYGHKLLDIYYKMKAKGHPFNDRIAAAFSYNPDGQTCECGCDKDDHVLIKGFNAYECHRCHHCNLGFRPVKFDLAMEARAAVLNRLREYFMTYQTNDFEPMSPEHVEVGFSESIYEDRENLFVLEGRIDLLAVLQGLRVVADHKFQMRKHDLYIKSIQFKNYALVAKLTTFIINYIRLSKSIDNTTMVRVPVSFSVVELLEWKQKLIKIFFDIKKTLQIAESHDLQVTQNWSACPGKYNYACQFTTLCEESDEEMRKMKMDQLYTINPIVWRPW